LAHYLDTSTLVKLVVAEAETNALLRWLRDRDRDPITSDLARTELTRVVRRAAPVGLVRARALLDSITVVAVSTATFESAGRLEPTMLRSLDAVHLAVALDLGDDLEGVVTYDDRLAGAARGQGIPVDAPR
jgi:uncharacterized protein